MFIIEQQPAVILLPSFLAEKQLRHPVILAHHLQPPPEVLLDCLLGPGLAPRQLGYQLLLADVLVIASETHSK